MAGQSRIDSLTWSVIFLIKAITLMVWFGAVVSFLLAKPGIQNRAIFNYLVFGKQPLTLSTLEMEHMVDVRQWFFILQVFTLSWVVPQKKYPNAAFTTVVLILSTVVCLFAFFNFDAAWTLFHHVLFNNQLWLLPSDSYLIEHFYDTFFPAVVSALGIWILLWINALIFYKKETISGNPIKNLRQI
ncbi:DUF1461 domain-containing protein [Coprothermobacter platensis]|uniref:lipoprotein intramolecular transacylase Lit n=1 Tax=Coprothermobacter platensis TaxID=108819 RepID=UPI0003A39150|nr:DUF1461 domain-containing protein [Coprothermobacter platensis]